MTRAKDRDDVAYINHIRLANPTNPPSEVRFVIADARPMLSAAANRGLLFLFLFLFSPSFLSFLFFFLSCSLREGDCWSITNARNTIVLSPFSFFQLFTLFSLLPPLLPLAMGAGYENPNHYKNTSLKFLDIHNIHVVRSSYKSLRSACLEVDGSGNFHQVNRWMSAIDDSQVKLRNNFDKEIIV